MSEYLFSREQVVRLAKEILQNAQADEKKASGDWAKGFQLGRVKTLEHVVDWLTKTHHKTLDSLKESVTVEVQSENERELGI